MNQAEAMREAHRIASDLINQARSTADEGWNDNADDHERIDAALATIASRHRRQADRHAGPSASGGTAPYPTQPSDQAGGA